MILRHSPSRLGRPFRALAITLLSIASHSASFALETAREADAFIDTIGVNIHLGYGDTAYGNYENLVKPKLISLGVRHIRDGMNSYSSDMVNKLTELSNLPNPISVNLIVPPSIVDDLYDAMPNAIASIEGPNETDNPNKVFSYDNKTFPQSTQAYQAALYTATKGESADIAVLAPSFMTGGGPQQVGIVPCDAGVLHSYPGGGLPDNGLDSGCSWLPLITGVARPVVATETGYFTFNEGSSSNQGVSEAAQAKYLPRLLLEYFRRGVARTYLYEFVDTWSATNAAFNNTNRESHFGLIAVSGPGASVTPREKPAFTNLKNLIAILQDPGTPFEPASLGFTLSGSNQTALRHVLLQKRDGSFWLILWQNVSSFNTATYTDVTPADQTVTITFNQPVGAVTCYRPSAGVSPVANSAIPSGSVTAITGLAVPDEPVILKITGANTTVASPIIADVAAYGAGEALLTSDSAVTYSNSFANATIFSSDYADEKIGSYSPNSTRAYRAILKFDLPVLPEGQIVQDVTLQVYLRAKSGSPASAAELVAFSPEDTAARVTDWNNTTNLITVGSVIAPARALGPVTIDSATYPQLGYAIRDAYLRGVRHIAFRLQLAGGAYVAGSGSSGDYYDIGSTKNQTAAQRPILSFTTGAPRSMRISLASAPANDGFLKSPSPYSAATIASSTDPSSRVGDSNLNEAYQAYYKFPLASIPAGAQITGARFGLYNRVKTGTPSHDLILQTYEPSSGPVQLGDWTNQTQAREIGDIFSPTAGAGLWTFEAPDLTSALRDAISRSSSFLGFRLKLPTGVFTTGTDTTFDYYSLGTTENTDANQRPYLDVEYY